MDFFVDLLISNIINMKKSILFVLVVVVCSTSYGQTFASFHDFSAETILGETISMSQYAGKKLLVVNTASFCAYTPQFATLQALDSTYEEYNFEVIGFPCNNFGNQDPYDDETILEFCQGTYGVTFQMMSRVDIVSGDTCEIYKWLQHESLNGVSDATVSWNFNKFCIDEYGHWVDHYNQQTQPFNANITDWIMSETPAYVAPNVMNQEWNISNNPASDFFSVSLKNMPATNGSIEILSSEGKLIDRIFSGNLSNGTYRYDATPLSSGLYFISLSAGDMHEVKKLSVLR